MIPESSGIRVDDIIEELRSLERRLAAAPPDSPRAQRTQEVWEVYAALEKDIAFLKFRLRFESPGEFVELPKSGGEIEELARRALLPLSEGVVALSKQRLVEGLGLLREARNYLRAYLTEESRSRTRKPRRRARPKPDEATSR